MLDFGNVVVNKFCLTHTDRIGAYRMLGNNSFNYADMADGLYRACKNNEQHSHYLCIQDTTELNFTNHLNRLSKEDDEIGPVRNEKHAGFFCHPVLVIDPLFQLPVGISSVEIWNRSWDKVNRHERRYHYQDIKDKESYRWITSAQRTKELLSSASTLTIIGDRESDIYDEFVLIPDSRTHLLIRSGINRRLHGEDINLFEKLNSAEQKATYELDIRQSRKRAKRKAKMSLKYEKVKIYHPKNRPLENRPRYVELWAIEAKELPESVPVKEEPILWRLLTTYSIDKTEDALRCVEWYSQRWFIEELFRVLKSKGLVIESAQLETGTGLKKLAVMAFQVALTTMTLKLSLSNNQKVTANLIFTNEQLYFLSIYMQKLEGKTQKLRNPYDEGTLQWAAWALARIGGWSGYISQGPPGYITIKNGLDRFLEKYDGFQLALNLFGNKDVYKG
ncbi:MAG: hypothetical protein A2Y71_06310 [Bacteroidetes bacterium RBG_13_42_15]|nr:MAG: hypothetical protein A2Y71_06310 [Bacteroidetes bacterium RBG_13_42_15]